RALVADDRLRAGEIRAHGLEHPAGDDDHQDPSRSRRFQRGTGARAEHVVRADERAVEVARDRTHPPRKRRRKVQDCVVRNETRPSICESVSLPANAGITLAGNPGTTYALGSSIDSFVYSSREPRFASSAPAARSSRLGPTLPAEPAGV